MDRGLSEMKLKITKSQLKSVILEEFKKLQQEMSDSSKRRLNTKRKQQQRRRDDIRWGGEEMRQLAKAIAEKNISHDEDGKFSSHEDAASHSDYFDKFDGVGRNSVDSSIPDKDDSGRGTDKNRGKGKYRMKDGVALWEDDGDGYVRVKKSALGDYISQEIQKSLESYAEKMEQADAVLQEKGDSDEWQVACNRRGFKSWKQFLTAINSVEAAKKGELFKPDK